MNYRWGTTILDVEDADYRGLSYATPKDELKQCVFWSCRRAGSNHD